MSSDDLEPYDWYKRFFGGRGFGGGGGSFDDMLRGFDQMKREMEREFEDIEKRIPYSFFLTLIFSLHSLSAGLPLSYIPQH